MTIVIIGNDEKLISYLHVIVKELPDTQINLLIEDDQYLTNEFKLITSQHALAPRVFSKIAQIDLINKTLITVNEGRLQYDALIIFPLLTPTIKIPKSIQNIHYPPFELSSSITSSVQKQQTTVLFISEHQEDKLHYNILKQKYRIQECKSEDILELHAYENKITSVTLRDKCVYPVDDVFYASMKYELPIFIQQTNYTQAQMELMDVFVLDQNEDLKLSQIFNKLKPSRRVLCIKNMELIPECDFLDRSQSQRLCHCHDICKIQNLEQTSLSSYFTKKMESKLASEKLDNTVEDLLFIDHQDNFRKAIQWVVDAKQSLERRLKMNNLSIPFYPPPELAFLGASAYLPSISTLKKSLKWILDANLFALKDLSNKKQIQQRVFQVGLSSIPQEIPFIIYFGSYHANIQRIYQSHKEAHCDIDIVSMGCSRLELSLSYGWAYLAGYLEQEYCFNHPQCCGIIFESPCLMNTASQLIESRKLPTLDLDYTQSDEQWISFFKACKAHSEKLEKGKKPRFERKVLLDLGNDKEIESFDHWILIPACSGNWTDSSFINHIKKYQEKNYAIFACGCSLTTLMNASFYSDYFPESQKRSFFGNGSFASIQDIAHRVNLKKVKVLLDGMIKNDALIDALSLKIEYGFPLVSHDYEVLQQLKSLEPYL